MYRFTDMTHSVYLIPNWIADTLKRHKLPLSAVLNFGQIKPILSMNDLLSIEAAQSFMDHLIGKDTHTSILYEWYQTANDVDKTYINTQIEPLSKDQFQRDTVHARLFTEAQSQGDDSAFEVVPLVDLAIGVVVEPGAFAGIKAQQHRLPLLRAILKQLYVYEKHGTVAASGLYLRYLEQLAIA